MQDGELLDVTVSDALRLLSGTQKTNSTHQYCRFIRLSIGAGAWLASGAEAQRLFWPGALVRGAGRGRFKCVVGVPLAVEPGSIFASFGSAFLIYVTFNQIGSAPKLGELVVGVDGAKLFYDWSWNALERYRRWIC
jgi:hypothetical protein